jgi:hypothetical protein
VRRALACAVIAWLGCPSSAAAQLFFRPEPPRAGSVELGAAVVWSGAIDQGSVSAEETRNSTTDTSPFVLFTASSRTQSATGAQGRVGVYLSRAFSIEGGVEYSRPKVSTQLADDAESAPDVTATETLTRIIVDGSGVFHLTGLSFNRGRGVPFLRAGGGYIREIHEKNEVIDTGREFHAGGGVKLWFGRGKHRTGFRFDGGAMFRTDGADAPKKRRTVPTAGASIVYLF